MMPLRNMLIALVALIALIALIAILFSNTPEISKPEFKSNDPATDAMKQDKPIIVHHGDLSWLVENSTLIFVGRLINQDFKKDERGLIITLNHFEIERKITGNFREKGIVLTTLGGTFGNKTLRVSHLPVFATGRRYLVFTDPNRTTYNPITGNQDGVFLVGPKDVGVYTYDGISVAGIEEGIIQPGELVLENVYQQDPHGPSLLEKNPDIQGNILSVEKAEIVEMAKEVHVKPVITLDQFAEMIVKLAAERRE